MRPLKPAKIFGVLGILEIAKFYYCVTDASDVGSWGRWAVENLLKQGISACMTSCQSVNKGKSFIPLHSHMVIYSKDMNRHTR